MGLTLRELRFLDANEVAASWFALAVKHQHERAVKNALESKSFAALAPLYRAKRFWSDRETEIDLPLFAGYVFCRFPYGERARVLTTPGVRRIVQFGGAPAPVEDAEIAAIEAMVESRAPLRPWPYLKPGDRVLVERGPLRGLMGTLIREKDAFRLVIGIELLQRSIAAEIAPDAVRPVSRDAVRPVAAGAVQPVAAGAVQILSESARAC